MTDSSPRRTAAGGWPSGAGRTPVVAGGALGLSFLGLVVASAWVPRAAPGTMAGAPVARGPDSYFHHVYDPQCVFRSILIADSGRS